MRTNSKAKQGFSLIEMMIATAILGFGMMGIAAMQINSMRGAQGGRDLTQAVASAQDQIEQLSRMDWSDLPAAGWTAPVAVTNHVESTVEVSDNVYMMDQRVSDVVVNQTRAVDVRISWTDPRRGARSFTLSTMKFNNGS